MRRRLCSRLVGRSVGSNPKRRATHRLTPPHLYYQGTQAGEALFGTRSQATPRVLVRKQARAVVTSTTGPNGIAYMAAVDVPGQREPVRFPPCASFAAAEAQAIAESPPIWQQDAECCALCDAQYALLRRRHHCRNCGHGESSSGVRSRRPCTLPHLTPLHHKQHFSQWSATRAAQYAGRRTRSQSSTGSVARS